MKTARSLLKKGIVLGGPVALIASVLFLGTLSEGICGDSGVTTVIVPINMAFPLLPTMAIINNQPGSSNSLIVVSFGADGVAGALRASARN